MAMATKEQERKALDKIRKIVAELGEDSYIATAFEGCFEDAEHNIECDMANSWKDRAEYREKEREAAIERVKELESRTFGLKTINEKLNKQVALKSERIDELNKQLEGAAKQWSETFDDFRKAQERATELEREVITLKAKLYDLLCK